MAELAALIIQRIAMAAVVVVRLP